jgi:ribokinase
MIYVLGSINADLVVYSRRFPEVGETIVGNDFLLNQGGKGANQAIAAQKAQKSSEETTFIGRVGNDYFGTFVLNSLRKENVKLRVKHEKDVPTGIAMINVNGKGENKIVIIHGANGKVDGSELEFLKERLKDSDILMMQGELNAGVMKDAAKIARSAGATVIFDPAPVSRELRDIIPFATFVTPNETEIKMLTGTSGDEGALKLLKLGAENVIFKRGEKGLLFLNKKDKFSLRAFSVNAVDTTGAGDTFNGAFAAALHEGRAISDALIFGEAAAALSVMRKGASVSSPHRNEIDAFLLKHSIEHT